MGELPDDFTRHIAAMSAVKARLRDLDLVYQDAQRGTFERGQELFPRWADGTRQMLSAQISKGEAQRFEDVTGLYTCDSLAQYFQEYSNYLEGLWTALQKTP